MTNYYLCLAAAIILVALVPGAEARFREQSSVDWRTFEVPAFGTTVEYPAGIFTPAGEFEMGVGQRFERADGRAHLRSSQQSRRDPQKLFKKISPREAARVGLLRIARSFFAVSSERDGVILYSRCNFSGGARGIVHCFDMKYPREEKRSWDALVTRISLSLRPLES